MIWFVLGYKFHLELSSNNDSPFICWGDDKEKLALGTYKKYRKKTKIEDSVLHGGILFFNLKVKAFINTYNDCKYALNKYDQLGFLRNFGNGMTDEVIFAWAIAKII